MADQQSNSNSNSFLAFVVGGLLVAVVVLAWLFYGGNGADDSNDLNISIEGPSDSAPAAEGAVSTE
ncbi:hypothetical protein [Roseovarius arcticus]|uniref:hypothetical protein n=1 Tax=Roseovarius arcticus TaxID=2547404 RepID=UPI001110DB17|nr:hypothetical protein [Roseovarius arcticus]